MRIDDYAAAMVAAMGSRKWQCTSALLVCNLHHYECSQYPAIQVAAAQVRQRPGGHQPMQGT
jgi:uncharacterized protein YjlB